MDEADAVLFPWMDAYLEFHAVHWPIPWLMVNIDMKNYSMLIWCVLMTLNHHTASAHSSKNEADMYSPHRLSFKTMKA